VVAVVVVVINLVGLIQLLVAGVATAKKLFY
jgi:hypothetical protein